LRGLLLFLVETRRFELRSNTGQSGRLYEHSLWFDLGSAAPKDRICFAQPSLESQTSARKHCRVPSHLCDALPPPDDGSKGERAT
jgi:hypothetical protein